MNRCPRCGCPPKAEQPPGGTVNCRPATMFECNTIVWDEWPDRPSPWWQTDKCRFHSDGMKRAAELIEAKADAVEYQARKLRDETLTNVAGALRIEALLIRECLTEVVSDD